MNIRSGVTGNVASQKTGSSRDPVSTCGSLRYTDGSRRSSGMVIYCDGACEPNPGIGGWGFVVYRDGVEIHADCGGANPTTNNIMEMTGALMALRWIAARLPVAEANVPIGNIRPRLFCDSQYVVKGCNEWRHGWKAKGWRRGGPNATEKNAAIANLDLWREIDAALTLFPITLEWCKGHAGIVGNERADELSLTGRERALAAQAPAVDDNSHRLEQIRQQLEMF